LGFKFNTSLYTKDQQIAQLVARCKKFEEEAAEKNRAVENMRSRMGREVGPYTRPPLS
jgi:hypothetical protein